MKHIARLSTCAVFMAALAGCQQQSSTPAPTKNDAAQLAAIQQQQQQAAAIQAQHDAELKKQVEQHKKKSNAFYVAKSKTWQKYIP